MSRENSALIALEELKNLEAQRVQQVHDDVQAKANAEQRAREEAERKARETAERERAAAEEKARQEQEIRETREREERIRVAETEARSRAEQEARLREEQMRLDAQVKMAERKKTPYWLYATAGFLAIGIGVGGYLLWENKKENERIEKENDEIAAQNAATEAKLAEAEAKTKELEDQITASAAKQEELLAALETAGTEAEKAKIQAQIDAEKAKTEELTQKVTATKKGGGGSKTPATKPITKGLSEDKKIKLGGDGSALGGL